MTSPQKELNIMNRRSMLPRLAPRSTKTSRAREQRVLKENPSSRTVPNTPKKNISKEEVVPLKCVESLEEEGIHNLTSREDIKSNLEHELQNKILELPTQLTVLCNEILTQWNTIIKSLLVMGPNHEMGEAMFSSNLVKWGLQNESLRDLVNATSKQSELDARSISNEVSGLGRKGAALKSENVQMKEEQFRLKSQLEHAKEQGDRARAESQSNCASEELTKRLEQEVRTYRARVGSLEQQINQLNAVNAEEKQNAQKRELEAKQREELHTSSMRLIKCKAGVQTTQIKELTEERDKLLSRHFNAFQEGEDLYKHKIAELEKCLKEQNEKVANATRDIGEAEIYMKRTEEKLQLVLKLVKLKDVELRNDKKLIEECNALRNKLTDKEDKLKTPLQNSGDAN